MAQTDTVWANSAALDSARGLVLREILTMGLESLRADKLRATMTALSMAVGTAALILVVTVALTGRSYVLTQIENVGTNVVWAEYSGITSGPSNAGLGDYLTVRDMAAVKQRVPEVTAASPVVSLHQNLVVQSRNVETLILGVDPQYQEVRRILVSDGRFFDQADSEAATKVALVSESLARRQFGSLDLALGQTLRVQDIPFVIIGTFRESVDTMGRSEIEDNTILVPYSVARNLSGSDAVNQLYFSMANSAAIPDATEQIRAVIVSRHRAGSSYDVSNMTGVLQAAKKIAAALTAILLLFAAVTLIAGGVGIMNIMWATVHSRIHEIGVRKAVGATRRAILLQFLCEALYVAMIGGLAGTIVGMATSISMGLFLNYQVSVSAASALIAFLVCCMIGVIFGITPAQSASRMDPVECLRHE
jgi:putative ABC transport system permease protein